MADLSPSIFELKSSWSRIIHRIHTLGVTRQAYFNTVSGFAERRVYPRQLPSHNEKASTSLDGTHLWRMENWGQGWVKVDRYEKKATFIFSSRGGGVFHKIDILDENHWDCLNCLIQVFIKKELKTSTELPLQALPMKQQGGSGILRGITPLLAKTAEEGQSIKTTMVVGGGLVHRIQKIEAMRSHHNRFAIKSESGQLIIDTSQVKHVDVSRSKNKFMSTLYNTNGVPQLIIEAA